MSKIIAENLDIVEVDTGEILTDIGRNGKERPWKSHKGGGLKVDNLSLQQKATIVLSQIMA